MTYLCLDTETTGFPDFNCRARDPSQPHIVQIAAIAFDDAHAERDCFTAIIKPDGWSIPAEASAVHGITTEMASAEGIPESEVAARILAMIRSSGLLVCHNITFDKFICRIAMRRFNLISDADDAWWKSMPTFCTMRKMTDVCRLPSTNGLPGFKWPRLQEAYEHAFQTKFDGAHDALADVRATARLYRWLQKRIQAAA